MHINRLQVKDMRKVFIFVLIVGVLMLGTFSIIGEVSDRPLCQKTADFSGEFFENHNFGDQDFIDGDGHGGDGSGPIPG